MSIIIDGMDQSHCKVPYLGTQSSFNHPLKQSITGIKEHGIGVTLYRTLDTVSKGSDLTIYCILSQIEEFRRRNNYYPETIYLQCDGGSENANQYLLALLELLVVKRVAREIFYTRLPTGHTHEDIDAVFAIIWKSFRSKSCETLGRYRCGLEKAFKDSCLNVQLKDVYVIPDYKLLLEEAIDSKLGRLHKDDLTQHQWRFEAVHESIYFPLGVKTTYRAYSSPKVVEFKKIPKQQCVTPIGRATGLEPVTLHCRWYPAKDTDPNRMGIEGFYLLKKSPHWDKGFFPPVPFPDSIRSDIDKCLTEVQRRYNNANDKEIRDEWKQWNEECAPPSNSAMQYIEHLKSRRQSFHVPLKYILLDRNKRILMPEWSSKIVPLHDIEPDFCWPEMIAAAMPSVVSEFTPHAPNPRLYINTDPQLTVTLNEIDDRLAGYYALLNSPTYTISQLKDILKTKIGFDGCQQILTGIHNSQMSCSLFSCCCFLMFIA